MQVGELHAKVTVDVSGIGKSLNVAKRQIKETNRSIRNSFASLSAGVKAGIAGIAVVLSTKLVGGIANTALEMERLNRSLRFATGGAANAKKSFSFLQDQATKLGLPLDVLIKSFIGLSAVTKDTALEGAETEKIFLGIAQASAALGLSSEQIAGSFIAIQQTLAKGTISAEEWRGQLAERIPIATRVLIKALGITTQELEKFMERGLLRSAEIIPIFVNALSNEVAPALNDLAGSTTEAVGKMQAAWFNLKKTFVESPIAELIVSAINIITASLEFLTKAIGKVVAGFTTLGSYLHRFVGLVDKVKGKVSDMFGAFSEASKPMHDLFGFLHEAQKKTIDQFKTLTNKARGFFGVITKEQVKQIKPIDDKVVRTPLMPTGPITIAADQQQQKALEVGRRLRESLLGARGPSFELTQLMDSLTSSIDSVTNSLTDFIVTGRIDFKEMISSILSDISRLIIRLYVLKPLIEAITNALGFGGKGIAERLLGGGGFGFANGGIINEPVAGVGLASGKSYTFGERGPETVTPGVGTGSTQITINAVDAASFNDMIRRNPNSILQVVTRSLKNGNSGMISAVRGAL